jgi:8-oxo-dGTP pyrophosphatase MutT (NUDIX family)
MTRRFTDAQTEAWLAGLPRKALTAKAIITSDAGRILLVKPTYKDTWQFPGGGVEAGEPPEAAAVREAREETGLVLDPTELRIVGTAFRPGHDTLSLIYEYRPRLPESTPIQLPARELEGYQFADPSSLTDCIGRYYHDFWLRYYRESWGRA